ncbi:galactose mutarotase-like [Marmota marmota marmota]|uniref:galactose mutarotase-like n=1 Tax=Marmota marmota marmota TaxID=9994 RepID=UPI002093F104|nr:galactose mutarotase-like [Marmota marmota marmota]
MVSVTRTVFGELPSGGGTVEKFQLQSDLLKVDIISWGCTITALEVKDRQGKASDVVLGFAELEGYLQNLPYFGAVIGRVANQIGKGTFKLDGKEYHLAINYGPNSLHGGLKGFDKVSPGHVAESFLGPLPRVPTSMSSVAKQNPRPWDMCMVKQSRKKAVPRVWGSRCKWPHPGSFLL